MDDLERMAVEAFEKGKEDTYIPQDPFVAFGFESNPFLKTHITELRKEKFLRSRITKVSAYIGKVYSSNIERKKSKSKKAESFVIDGALYGSSHSGTSTLIKFTHHLLKKHSNIIYADTKDLVTILENQYYIANTVQNFRNFLGKYDTDAEPSPLVIIDHADFLVEFFETFRDAFDRDFQDIPIVFIFTHSGWTRLKNELAFSSYDLFNRIVQSIQIEPVSSSNLTKILSMKLSKEGRIQKPFSQEIINRISQITFGDISNAINICTRLCEECFYNGHDTASINLVNDVSSILWLDKSQEFFDLITTKDNTQTEILALIAIKSIANDFGATYEEIVANSDEISTKTSASHHLKQLENKKYIVKRTINRKAFYKLREELKSLADTYLLPRFEQKDKYVRLESISEMM
jgi:hypothetical protein